MKRMMKIIAIAFCIVFSTGLGAQERDSVMYQRDSAIISPTEATTMFFQTGEKLPDLKKIVVITPARKTISLSSFLSSKTMVYADHVLADLDDDGKKELLISNFTGAVGSSSFNDEIWFYRSLTPGKFQYAGKLLGGTTMMTPGKEFIYHFNGLDGFYTCTGCVYTDTSDAAPIAMKEITVTYSKGKLLLPKGDQELRSVINDNLGKLGEHLAPLPTNSKDDGTRREIALNLLVYYYSFGKNVVATKSLFSKYYKAPDAKSFWSAFTKQLQQVSTKASF